ncbi:MAG: glycine oxidase ThiO [Nitrosomonadaceae bacterium]
MATDVVVIGGGVIGLTTAHELLRLGAGVSILERSSCGSEASWAGGGILSPLLPWNYLEPVTQLTQLSNRLFPGLIEILRQETGVDPEYQTCGMLVLPNSNDVQNAQYDGAEAWCARNAFPMKRVCSSEIAPRLIFDDELADKSALWLSSVAQVRSPRLLQALKRSVELSGGVIMEHTKVTGWRLGRGRVESVITDRGEYTGVNYVVAAGAWSRAILGEHALKLDIYPVRGQMLLFKAAPNLLRTVVLQNGFYLIPRQDGYILAGSTMEEVGFDQSITAGARKALLEKAHALLPTLTEKTLVGHWAGLRPGSPDNIPVISRHPAIDNLYLNSGHHRYGVTMAPGSAQLLSNMLMNNSQPFDVTPYQWPA